MTVVISERGICAMGEMGDNGASVWHRSDVCNMKLHSQGTEALLSSDYPDICTLVMMITFTLNKLTII